MSTRQVETAQSTDAPPAAGRSLSSYAGAALFAPTRLLFRGMVRLGSTATPRGSAQGSRARRKKSICKAW